MTREIKHRMAVTLLVQPGTMLPVRSSLVVKRLVRIIEKRAEAEDEWASGAVELADHIERPWRKFG